MQTHMIISELLPERSNRRAYMAGCTGLIALPGEKKAHQGGNQTSLSHKSWDLSESLLILKKCTNSSEGHHSSGYKTLLCASEVLMLAGLFTCFAGCFSPCRCDFSHRTHQSWENASCSGSKNHSPSCSRYDIKWKCEIIAYWLQISMLLSFMHGYQEEMQLLPQPTFENTQMSSWNSSSHSTEIWKSVWASNMSINLEL